MFPSHLHALTQLVDYFPYKTFPGQSHSQTGVSRTICIEILNTLECSCSKINDELSCATCTYDYMLLIISLVCIIIFLSLLCQFVAFIFHVIITKFTLYPLLDALPSSPRILTSGLQAHISRRSVFTHIMYMKIP